MKLIATTPIKVGGKRVEEGAPFEGERSLVDQGLAVTSTEAKKVIAEEEAAEAARLAAEAKAAKAAADEAAKAAKASS